MVENLKALYNENELKERIERLAKQINEDYAGRKIIVISILKGAVFFTVDLVKKIQVPIEMEFMQISSYAGTETTGKIDVKKDLESNIEGKDVLIVEDIIDTGYTMKYLQEYLLEKKPSSLKTVVLLDKKERREVDVKVDYTGFVIPNKFVIGYGLDYNQEGRNLPYLGYIEE